MRRFREGSSARHIVTLMTGTALAQAIPVAISPILARIYAPSEMGLLALFLALAAIPAAIASGRYELAILLAVDDDEAANVAALSLLIAVCAALLLLSLVALVGGPIARLIGNEEIRPWLYLVPLSVLFSSLFTVLNYLNSRAKRFRDIAHANVWKSVALGVLQLVGGALKAESAGLIVGQVASLLAGNGRLYRNTLSWRAWRLSVSRKRLREVATRYARFPKFITGSTLANAFANNFGSVLISAFYSAATLGFYSMGQRTLGAPLQLIGNAVGQVYFQRVSEAKRKGESAYMLLRRGRNALLICSLTIFVPLYFTIEPLFAFVFGEDWRLAGEYARAY